ncbi:hypothetical protein B0H66DRAFT_524324 [Apodospora peruviana]|uniref:Zn(2)-C6 fungal-type domain-containing protein n=1 Tax=Apodospora peruviana TaxID=516989 RepID=A0AAE0HTZ0_9PEZI|nr:hypothetical protein B0H66DRAFT_524324 [Apodospora peruviana]
MSEPTQQRRRRRPAISCTLCRRRKIRCNRESPCSNCIRSRIETCVYDNPAILPPVYVPQHESSRPLVHLDLPVSQETNDHGGSTASPYSAGSTTSSQPSRQSAGGSLAASSTLASHLSTRNAEVESLKNRIRLLESQLANTSLGSAGVPSPSSREPLNHSIETMSSELAGTFHVQRESRLSDQPTVSRTRIVHKTRVLGQSHWVNGCAQFKDIFTIIEPVIRGKAAKAAVNLERCKSLARFIKANRCPSWPTPPRGPETLPSKEVADKLVNCYLKTIETVYRILHVPSFRRDYEAVWTRTDNSLSGSHDNAFMVQLKLVLALGAVSYDDRFSLRTSALQWIYEAQTYVSEPEFKPRLNIQFLQTHLLVLIAREMSGMGGDLVWISAGSLLRTALYMGLHRDPAHLPKRGLFDREMHRRMWNSIIEVALSGSMSSGGPPLISLEDFDTAPPGNYDDEQLVTAKDVEQQQQQPVPKLEGDYTQTSVALALRKTFPLRLAIAKFLNDLISRGTYEETLRLDADLRAAYKVLCRTLQRCRESSGSGRGPSQFTSRWVDFQMHRYLSALHVPFFGSALRETAYAFSRKVVVETALKIWHAAYPSPSIVTATTTTTSSTVASNTATSSLTTTNGNREEEEEEEDIFARLTVCGAGFIRTVPYQSTLVIAAEIRTQLQEESTCLGPVPLRPDLLSVVEDARRWTMMCHHAGETNVKGFLLTSLVAAQVRGLMAGLTKDEFPIFILRAVEEAEEEVLPLFEERAANAAAARVGAGQQQQEIGVGGGDELLDWVGGGLDDSNSGGNNNTPSSVADLLLDNWGFMYDQCQMPDVMFNPGGGGGEEGGGMMNMEPGIMDWAFSNDDS